MKLGRVPACSAAVVLALLTACSPSPRSMELRIGTAGMGGAYYPLGQGIANIINVHLAGHTMVPIVTRGAVDNVRLLTTGDIDVGITNADLAYFAYRGTPPYEAPLAVLAAGALHPSVLHLVVLERSGVRRFEDLRGRRVAVGPVGGPTAMLAERLLEAHGMTRGEVVSSYLSYADGFGQLTDGNVDAAFALAGYPAAAVVQTQATHRIALIDLDPATLEGLLAANPYYRLVEVPGTSYGLSANTRALAVDNLLVVRADESPERVLGIVSAIYGHLDELAIHDASARAIEPGQSTRLPIPLHPGAQRYFESGE